MLSSLFSLIFLGSLSLVFPIYISPPPEFPDAFGFFVFSEYGTLSYDPGPIDVDPDFGFLFYDAGTVVTVTISSDSESNSSYTRFVVDEVEGEGVGSYSGPAQVFAVTMNDNIFEQVYWTTQYWISFDTSGISGETGSATIATIDGAAKNGDLMPFVGWYDSGSTITFSYSSPVDGVGMRYTLTSTVVTYYDASGNLLSESLSGSYGPVWTTATITGIYTASTLTTTTATGGAPAGSTTTSSLSSTTNVGGVWTSSTDTYPAFSLPDVFGSAGGLSLTGFSDWFGGQSCPIDDTQCFPNKHLLVIGVAFFFIILFLYKRKKNKKKKRRKRRV